MAYILVADDDLTVRLLLEAVLQSRGHEVVLANDGEEALARIRKAEPDLAILDIAMPYRDGVEVCAAIRAEGAVRDLPVILLSSRQEVASRLSGFAHGADDYVCKPFEPMELLVRVEALLRRCRRPDAAAGAPRDDLELDPDRFTFSWSGGQALLTRTEFSIMQLLLGRRGKVVGVAALLQEALGYPRGVGAPDNVHIHIRNIRRKIEADPAQSKILVTVAKLGYSIVAGGPT